MLPCTLAPVRLSQSSLARGNTLLQRVRLGVQTALVDEGRGLLQKQEHFIEQFSRNIIIFIVKELTAKQKTRLPLSTALVLLQLFRDFESNRRL